METDVHYSDKAELRNYKEAYRLGALMTLEAFEGKEDLMIGGDA